jgi:hypothetical protein
VHDLHALRGTAQRDRVHHAATRRAPVARCDVHMQRRQAMRTVISVAPICQRPHVAVADDATEAAILLASAHAPTPWCRSCRAPRSWVPFPLFAWVAISRLAPTSGRFTADFAVTSGSCFTELVRIRTTASSCRPLSRSFRHVPPVGVCRAHWHRRRPQIRQGRSAEPCSPSHLLVSMSPSLMNCMSAYKLRLARFSRHRNDLPASE